VAWGGSEPARHESGVGPLDPTPAFHLFTNVPKDKRIPSPECRALLLRQGQREDSAVGEPGALLMPLRGRGASRFAAATFIVALLKVKTPFPILSPIFRRLIFRKAPLNEEIFPSVVCACSHLSDWICGVDPCYPGLLRGSTAGSQSARRRWRVGFQGTGGSAARVCSCRSILI